ncbi:hypothetical protein BDV19DRAFT_236275 [Aspergillus venezuelensis]
MWMSSVDVHDVGTLSNSNQRLQSLTLHHPAPKFPAPVPTLSRSPWTSSLNLLKVFFLPGWVTADRVTDQAKRPKGHPSQETAATGLGNSVSTRYLIAFLFG